MWLRLTDANVNEVFLLPESEVMRVESIKGAGSRVMTSLHADEIATGYVVRETPDEIAAMLGVVQKTEAVDDKAAKYEKALLAIVNECNKSSIVGSGYLSQIAREALGE